MQKMIMMTDIKSRRTYILEIWRKGSKVIHASAMPAEGPEADRRVELRSVPLYIRRAAKAVLIAKKD